MNYFYLTTTLPYVNADPHLGHALEFVQGDVRCRFETTQGKKVHFNIGLDEHGTKIYQCAKEKNTTPKEFVDMAMVAFKSLIEKLNVKPARFIRTTDTDHYNAVKDMWLRCEKKGDIYKKEHKGYYCIGCELFLSDADHKDTNECPLHPGKKIEYITEENYFFRLSKYQDELLALYKNQKNFVIPQKRLEEVCAFVGNGLEDISISRSKKRLPWGVPVPNDDTQIVYVWFDALTNYLTTIGWPQKESWQQWWPVVQIAGKDNLRQQCVIWQAMLLSAGIKPSKMVYIHGFLTIQGKKMSKTTGNVIHPNEILKKYGTDFTRLYLTKHIHPYEDTDISYEHIGRAYEADAAKGIGNLVARIMKMSEEHLDTITTKKIMQKKNQFDSEYCKALECFDYRAAIEYVWNTITEVDKRITEKEPFKLIQKDNEKGKKEIQELVEKVAYIAYHLKPFMPETATRIEKAIIENKKPDSLFPKVS